MFGRKNKNNDHNDHPNSYPMVDSSDSPFSGWRIYSNNNIDKPSDKYDLYLHGGRGTKSVDINGSHYYLTDGGSNKFLAGMTKEEIQKVTKAVWEVLDKHNNGMKRKERENAKQRLDALGLFDRQSEDPVRQKTSTPDHVEVHVTVTARFVWNDVADAIKFPEDERMKTPIDEMFGPSSSVPF